VGPCFARVFDDSPLRQGRFIAGTDIPVVRYDGVGGGCCVILAWNYAEDISKRLKGQFDSVVTVLPSVKVW
jgi:hypothetical protein